MADVAAPVRIDPRYHDAVLFDLDGVITDTASLHQAAWKELFDDYLRRREPSDVESHDPFTAADYRHFIDGKPRYDAVRDFLASRGITLPWGALSDSDAVDTVCGLGNRKQQHFVGQIAAGRRADPFSTETHIFQFQVTVFAQANFFEKFNFGWKHIFITRCLLSFNFTRLRVNVLTLICVISGFA